MRPRISLLALLALSGCQVRFILETQTSDIAARARLDNAVACLPDSERACIDHREGKGE